MKLSRSLLISTLFYFTIFNCSLFSQNYWESLSEPTGGGVKCIVVTSTAQIFIGMSGGGIYTSISSGDEWKSANNGLEYGTVNALAVTPSDEIFAGTNRGLYLSTDMGDSWEIIYDGSEVTSLLTDQSGKLYACIDNSVRVTTDYGANWQFIMNGLPSSFFYFLTMTANGYLYITCQEGIFCSTDSGSSWSSISSGLPSNSPSAFSAAPNGDLFAAYFLGGLYRSTDNGSHWVQVNTGLDNLRIFGFLTSESYILTGTADGIYKSTDGGTTWTASNQGFSNTYTGIRCFASTPEERILAGNDAVGILISDDQGESWVFSNKGLHSCLIQCIAKGHLDVMVCAAWGALFISQDGGLSWAQSDYGITNTLLNTAAVHPNGYLFAGSFPSAGTPTSGIFRSTDNGLSWNKSMNGWAYNYNNILGFDIDLNGNIYVASNDNVYKSTDAGETWFRASTGITNALVYSIVVGKGSSIFAGTYGSGVFRSTDRGVTWEPKNTGLQATEIMALAVNSQGHIFAASNGSGVFRSTDKGDTWAQVFGTGRFIQTWSIAVNDDDEIYTGVLGGQYADFGVWYSTDNGNSWIHDNSGIYGAAPQVLGLNFNHSGYAFAGTVGAGLYRSVNTTVPVKEDIPPAAEQFSLEQNYPNPFNPITSINFSIPAEDHVTLKIYDIVGNEIKSLVDGVIPAGYYQVRVNGENLSSGVYLYTLKTKGFSETKKMILQK